MVSIKKFLTLFVFFMLQFHAESLPLNFLNERLTTLNLYSNLEKVLKSCFVDRLHTLVITNDLTQPVYNIVNENNEILTVFLIDENFMPGGNPGLFLRWPTFILSTSSEAALTALLQKLKQSAFWNLDSTFFIVADGRDRCENAWSTLWATWKMSILASFYICEHSDREVMLYTYNPYTSRAPTAWKPVRTHSDRRWTLYSRQVSKDQDICRHLEFDKTKHLDGYPVNVVLQTGSGEIRKKKNNKYEVELYNKDTYQITVTTFITIWTSMNMKPVIHYDLRGRWLNGKPVGYLPKLMNGSYDVTMFGQTLSTDKSFSVTYPRLKFHISIVTRHREFLTPEEKIANFYHLQPMLLTLAVFLITWVIFTFRIRGEGMSAALEVLRMALSTGILHPLQGCSIRIYLFGVLWLVLILNATFQGNISAFLTKPERIDIQTVKQLIDYKYQVYLSEYMLHLVGEDVQNIPKSNLRVIPAHPGQCIDKVLNNTKMACIQHEAGVINSAMKYRLHIAHKPLKNVYFGYPYRKDWPLGPIFNKRMSQLSAAGLLQYWKNAEGPNRKIYWESVEQRDTEPVIRPIKLKDLVFAFTILAVGLPIATLFFIAELGRRKALKNVEQRPKLPNPKRKFRRRVGQERVFLV